MPSAITSPTADAVEAIFDAHAVEGTFSTPAPHGREGNTCRCGSRHPLHDNTFFPTHERHLAILISTHFGLPSGTRETDRTIEAIERVMSQHAIARSFHKDLPVRREVDQCRCGTQHPPTWDPRWATHRRHLAEQIAAAIESRLAVTPGR